MSKIVVYTEESFNGRKSELKNNVHDLEERGFNKVISSIQVIGTPWVAYYNKNSLESSGYLRKESTLPLRTKEGFLPSRLITDDLENPEIQLLEHVNYGGRSVTLRRETNLHDFDFSDIASSHKVKGGVWVLYDHVNRQGAQLVSFPGNQVPSYLPLSFNDAVSHVRPLLPKP